MALRWFGGPDAALTVQNPETGAWMPNDAGAVWDAETGGTRLTDLVDANQAPIPGGDIYTDDYGYPPLFGIDADPATEVVWVDFTGGTGQRVRLECRDRATYRIPAADRGANSGVATLDAQGRVQELTNAGRVVGVLPQTAIPDLSGEYAPAALVDSGLRVVEHGSNASEPRPSWAGPVMWVGSVQPVNIAGGDLWAEVSTGG